MRELAWDQLNRLYKIDMPAVCDIREYVIYLEGELARKRGSARQPIAIGEKFGTYTLVEEIDPLQRVVSGTSRKVRLKCECGCGTTRLSNIYALRSGRIPICKAQSKRTGPRPNNRGPKKPGEWPISGPWSR